MKDTSLFNECNGCLQVLSHAEVQHDARQPPPAAATQVIVSAENGLVTYDHIQRLKLSITRSWDDLPAK